MTSKAFLYLILAVVGVGAVAGGAVAILSKGGGSPNNTVNAQAIASPTPAATGTPGANNNFRLNAEPISGTVVSVTSTDLTLLSNGSNVDIAVPSTTPVSLSGTLATAADDLTAGTNVVAILQRDANGNLSATNLIIGNAPGGGRFGGGGSRFGGGGTTGGTTTGTPAPDTSGFNAVTATVVSFANDVLTLDTGSGNVDVNVTSSTPVRVTIPFSDATGKLTQGMQVTAIGQRDASGTYTPFTITTGGLRLSGGFGGPGGTGGTGGGAFGSGGFRFRRGGGTGSAPDGAPTPTP